MASDLFYLPPTYVPSLPSFAAKAQVYSLAELCAACGVRCRASGDWTSRVVRVLFGEPQLFAEPGDWGAVLVVCPFREPATRAAYALNVMAYSMFDLVARESIRGAELSRPANPRGRPRTGRALTNAERQRLFRRRQRQVN